jgi:hypothetical protein
MSPLTISEPKTSSNSFMNELNLALRRCSKAICLFATLAMQASRALYCRVISQRRRPFASSGTPSLNSQNCSQRSG